MRASGRARRPRARSRHVPVQVRLVLHDVSASADNPYPCPVTRTPSLRAARPILVVPESTRSGLTADAEVPTDRCHALRLRSGPGFRAGRERHRAGVLGQCAVRVIGARSGSPDHAPSESGHSAALGGCVTLRPASPVARSAPQAWSRTRSGRRTVHGRPIRSGAPARQTGRTVRAGPASGR